jgi:hypothetical protein
MRRFVLPMLVALLALGGALALTIGSAAPGAPITEASNQRAATRDDHLLLARLVLPADAERSPRQPSGSGLDERGEHYTDPHFIDQHAWWVVPRPEQAVRAFITAHPPAGSHLENIGSSELWFEWPAIKSVLHERSLTVQFSPLPDGSTAVRADAQDVWEVPRPASERVPSSARILNIFVVSRPSRGLTHTSLSITVTDTDEVSTIAAMIDRLATRQPFSTMCRAGEEEGPLVVFDFRASQRGPVLAQASHEASGEGPCTPMYLWIYKHKQTPLTDGSSLIQQAEKLLHVTL